MARVADRDEGPADDSIAQLIVVEPKYGRIGRRMQGSHCVLNLRDAIRIHQDLPANNGRVAREGRHADHYLLVRKLAQQFGADTRREFLNRLVELIGPKLSDEGVAKDNGDVGCAWE